MRRVRPWTAAFRWKILWLNVRGGAVLALNGVVDFLAMNRNMRRRGNSQTDLVTPNINDRDLDVVADHDRFISLTR